jgi:predicted Zn-dependent protease
VKTISLAAIAIGILSVAGICSAQSNGQQNLLAERALQEYKAGQYAAAERDRRELVKQNPSNILAQIYLGQSL